MGTILPRESILDSYVQPAEDILPEAPPARNRNLLETTSTYGMATEHDMDDECGGTYIQTHVNT